MVNIRPLSPALQKKAIEELNEDPERIPKDLETFREWIKKSSHLKARDDDQFLISFLRGCKYSLERAKQKFDLYHTLKTHIPELTRNRDPASDKVLAAIRQGVGVMLPNKESEDGPRYILVRPGVQDTSKSTIEEIIKIAIMMNDLMMIEDDNFVVAGQVTILDFTGVSMSHFLQFNPTFIKKMTMLQQDAAPIRQKASHFVHMPAIALTVFNLFQSFANEKNKQRIYVHGADMDALYKVVPRKLLPEEYGGEAGAIADIVKASEERLLAHREFFIEDEKYGVEEKKRVGKPKNADSLFGLDGSFRQLAID